MTVAFRCLPATAAAASSGFGLLFNGTDGYGDLDADMSYADFDITIDIVRGVTATQILLGALTTANRIIFTNETALSVTIASSSYSIPMVVTAGSPAIIRLVRTGSTMVTYLDSVEVDSRTVTTGNYLIRRIARGPATPYTDAQYNRITVGTPAEPLQHDWKNTSGSGATFKDFGTVGGADFTLFGGYTWVAL